MIGNQRTMLAYSCVNIRIEALLGGIWREHSLIDVWCIPGVGKNFFSVSTAAERGFTYRLDMQKCELVKDSEVIVTGEKHRGLYKLHIRSIKPEMPAEVFLAHQVKMLHLRHDGL